MENRAPPNPSSGVLFGWRGILAMLCVAGLAAWNDFGLPVLLSGTVAVLAIVAHAWNRIALTKLAFERTLERTRVFPGQSVDYSVRLDNRKLLPLVWINAKDRIPRGIAPTASQLPDGVVWTKGELSVSASLLWYQRASWHCRLNCRKRGYFRLGPASLTSGDIFGLFDKSRLAGGIEHVIVYPRIFPLSQLGLPSKFPLGEALSPNPAFADPTRTRGIRDYTPDVPFHHIHWKASARTQRLQTKVFEPSCALRASLFLDSSAFLGNAQEPDIEGFELAISTLASIARHLIEERHAVGLYSDTELATGEAFVAIRAASGTEHLSHMLEALAKAKAKSIPFPRLLATVRPQLTGGGTLGIVTGGLTPEAIARLTKLQRHGFPVVVFHVGDQPAPQTPFMTRTVSPMAAMPVGDG
ncbi:MAG: DUF58 domain-containing protein [Rhodospirillales bacterium]|nr:DUF58 domain-containing protein [Rhodospirillales bacterium]